MKIQIVGAGVIGQATGRGFARLGHEVTFFDLDGGVMNQLREEGYNVSRHPAMENADIYFLCVPESVIEKVVEKWATPERLLVIRSTVPPGTADRLSRMNCHICSNPEFLREAVAEYEFLNPPGIIIGPCCPEHRIMLEKLYKPFQMPIRVVKREVAEFTKLVVNGYLACQISYWNQIKLLADALGINSHEVGMLASYGDDRVSPYGARMHGKPYSGKCLPKDLQQLIGLCQVGRSVNSQLLEAIKAINDYYLVEGSE